MPPSTFLNPAYLYTVALIIEPLLPEVDASYLNSLSLKPIARRFVSMNVSRTSQVDLNTAFSLTGYPIDMAYQFRVRMGLVLTE
jgi:hypothetical protein